MVVSKGAQAEVANSILIALGVLFGLIYLVYGVRTGDVVTIGGSNLILGASLLAAVM